MALSMLLQAPRKEQKRRRKENIPPRKEKVPRKEHVPPLKEQVLGTPGLFDEVLLLDSDLIGSHLHERPYGSLACFY